MTTRATPRAEKYGRGSVPSNRTRQHTDPADTETHVIGGHTFKFLTTLVTASASFTQVKRGVSAAQSRTDLIKAINGTTSANVVPCTTPHTLPLVADLVDTDYVRCRLADAKGGNPICADPPSIAFSETLGDAADVWERANINEGGEAAGKKSAVSVKTITAQNVTAVKLHVEFDFTPTKFKAQAYSSAGVQRSYSDATVIDGNSVKVTLGGGASPNLQAGDVLVVEAWE